MRSRQTTASRKRDSRPIPPERLLLHDDLPRPTCATNVRERFIVEQANRLYEIARDTLVHEVPGDPPLSKYEQRLLDGECTRCGVELSEERKEAGHSMCAKCHGYVLKAKRRSAKKQRLRWKRKRLCGQCGKQRRPGGKLCPGCTVKCGVVPKSLVDHYVDHGRDRTDEQWGARVEQSPDGKPRARRRFLGQGKRGRQSGAQLDEQDLVDARRCIEEGWLGLVYYRSSEVQALPRIQREEVRHEAVRKIERGQEWLDEIIGRNSPKSRRKKEQDDE